MKEAADRPSALKGSPILADPHLEQGLHWDWTSCLIVDDLSFVHSLHPQSSALNKAKRGDGKEPSLASDTKLQV